MVENIATFKFADKHLQIWILKDRFYCIYQIYLLTKQIKNDDSRA